MNVFDLFKKKVEDLKIIESFKNEDDIYSSSIETMVDEKDIEFFKECTYNID